MSSRAIFWLALPLALLPTSCDDAQAPEPADPLADEVAEVAGSLVAADLLTMQGQGLPGFGMSGMLFPLLRSGTPRCGGATPCTPASREGLLHERTITFLDAEGVEQAAYDSLTTAAIRFELAVSGSIERPGWSAEVQRTHDLVLSGLVGSETEATWNGTGGGSMRRTAIVDGVERTSIVATSSLVEEVVVARGSTSYWPLSGSITQTHRVTREAEAGSVTIERTAVITFDGSRYAQLTIGDRSYLVDLARRGLAMTEGHRRGTGGGS